MLRGGVGTQRLVVAATAGLLAALACAAFLPQASATFPGKNGRIAYASNEDTGCGDIHLVKPSGAGDRDITNTPPFACEYQPSFSPNGRKLVFEREADIWVISSKGKGLKQLTTSGDAGDPAFSANGRRVVFVRSIGGGDRDIWIMRKDGSRQRQLTNASGEDEAPSFAANGKLIVFQSGRDGDTEIFTMRSNGNRERQLTDNDVADYDPSFAPNSKRIVFARNGSSGGLFSMKKGGSGENRLTTHPTLNEFSVVVGSPTFSPNGKRIAYRDLEIAGQQKLITMSKGGGNEQVLVDESVTGGDIQSPDWGPKPSKKKRRGGRR